MIVSGDTTVARVLDGRAIAAAMHAETKREIEALTTERGEPPQIRVLLIGVDPASRVYARRILRATQLVGAGGALVELPETAPGAEVRRVLGELSDDPAVSGVIMQLPLPSGLDVRTIIESLDPLKDLDGIHPFNAGLVSRGSIGFAPSCAEAALQILKRSDITLAGARAVVLGRSTVVGRPVAQLLTAESATVTVCHRRTVDLAATVRDAEVVVAGAGVPGLVSGDMLAQGAVVVDCGINVLADGAIVGDVDTTSAMSVAGAITPVPGGVGPVTNAILMSHLARAARAQLEGGFPDALVPAAG